MDVLAITVIVLWVVVIALAVVVFALARQVGVLYERVAPAGALMINRQLKVGDAAPQITVETLTGKRMETGGVGDKQTAQLLFFLAPDCPICKSLLPVLKSLHRAEPQVGILLVSDGDDLEEHHRFVRHEKLDAFDYTLSEVAGRSFGVGKLPYGILIDERGVVASLGIVNSREHLESLFESQRLGVASIQEYLNPQSDSGVHHYEPSVIKEN